MFNRTQERNNISVAKSAGITHLLAVIVLALCLLGTGGYFLPRLGQVANGQIPGWQITTEAEPLTPFEEQTFLQTQYEQALAEDITTILETILGRGHVRATVRAQLALTRELAETSGIMASHLTQTQSRLSVVRHLSVSVLLTGPTLQNAGHAVVYQPLSRAELQKYTDLVKTIVGYDPQRGDVVEVSNTPFAEAPAVWPFGLTGPVVLNGVLLFVMLGLTIWALAYFILPLVRLLVHAGTPQPDASSVAGQTAAIKQQSPERLAALIRDLLHRGSVRKNPRAYAPAEQAAVFVLTLDKPVAESVLRQLSYAEARKLGQLIARLGPVSATDSRRIRERFARALSQPAAVVGSPEAMSALFQQAGLDGAGLSAEIRLKGTLPDIWQKMAQLEITTLLSFLKTQSPETTALILFHLPDTIAGRLLAGLPEDLRPRVVMHLTHMRRVSPEVLDRRCGEIADRLLAWLAQSQQPAGSDRATAILKTLSPDQRQEMLHTIANNDPETARHMRQKLATWDDVLTLSDEQMRAMIKHSDCDLTAIALTGADAKMQAAFARQMTPAVWQRVQVRMKTLTPNEEQIKQARETLVRTGRDLNLFQTIG